MIVDFTDTSRSLVDHITQAGGFAVDCDHGGNHCGAPSDYQLAGWEFLKAHPLGVETEPYAEGSPPIFPATCSIQ